MTVPIHREGDPCNPRLVAAAGNEWRTFPSLLSKGTPRGVAKYLGRRPAHELRSNEYADAHWQFALLLALAGQVRPLIPLFRGDVLMEEAVKPYREISLELRRPVYRWCAQRVGLTGWGEVFDVPPGSEPLPDDGIPRVNFYQDPERCWADLEVDEAGLIVGSDPVRGSDLVAVLRLELDRLAWLIVAQATPWMNDCGWTPEWMAREIDWSTRCIRALLGLPPEQPVPLEDPRVELPPEFTGFVAC